MIQFFNNEDTVGSASIYEAHITFNKSINIFATNQIHSNDIIKVINEIIIG